METAPSLTALPPELTRRVYNELPLANRAALGATCRALRHHWQEQRFGADTYGSSVPHRFLGASPTSQQWRDVTRERVLAGGGPVPTCTDIARGGPQVATQALMALAGNAGNAELNPAAWQTYFSALRAQGRHDEARPFGAKLVQMDRLVRALRTVDVGTAQALVAAGTPLRVGDVPRHFFSNFAEVRDLVLRTVSEAGDTNGLLELFATKAANDASQLAVLIHLPCLPTALQERFHATTPAIARCVLAHRAFDSSFAQNSLRAAAAYAGPRAMARMGQLLAAYPNGELPPRQVLEAVVRAAQERRNDASSGPCLVLAQQALNDLCKSSGEQAAVAAVAQARDYFRYITT